MSSIDLRSDTVTRPTEAMLAAMMAAPTGDDVYGEDPTVNRLQDVLAERFGHEAGLFCPSGTMANQIAINVHTQPGDEVVCHRLSHIYNYEGGGIARNSGASVRLGASASTEAPPLSSADAGTIAARICSSSSGARARRKPGVTRAHAKRESVLATVGRDGHALQFAPRDLRGDRANTVVRFFPVFSCYHYKSRRDFAS